MKRCLIMVGFFFVLAFADLGYADLGRFAVSGKIGTLGAGAEVTTQIVPNINARLGINAFGYDYRTAEGGIEYGFDLRLRSFSALLDWHPFGGGFRLSGGLLVNQNEIKTQARFTEPQLIGGRTFTPGQIGTLRGDINFNDLAPYVGTGWGNAVGDGRFGIVFDVGILFQGPPHVSLTADGTLATDAIFQAELARERQELAKGLDAFRYYPVIAVGVFYRF